MLSLLAYSLFTCGCPPYTYMLSLLAYSLFTHATTWGFSHFSLLKLWSFFIHLHWSMEGNIDPRSSLVPHQNWLSGYTTSVCESITVLFYLFCHTIIHHDSPLSGLVVVCFQPILLVPFQLMYSQHIFNENIIVLCVMQFFMRYMHFCWDK